MQWWIWGNTNKSLLELVTFEATLPLTKIGAKGWKINETG